MKFNIYFFFGLYVILYPACQPALKVQKQPADLLEQLMSKEPTQFDSILKNRNALKVQIINTQLHHKGYKSADIVHRLSVFLSEDENRHTNPVSFYDDHASQVYSKGLKFSNISYPKRFDSIGKGYYSGGKLIQHPMDFSKK